MNRKLTDKMLSNSFWETYTPNTFQRFSQQKAKDITRTGKKLLRQIQEKIEEKLTEKGD